MPANNLYEYAIIRFVPRVEREEFVNVGVILYCRNPQFLQMKFSLDANRLVALYPQVDVEEVKSHLNAFERICLGHVEGGPIALLDIASRFRWLTAKRSTIVQTSQVHPGLCFDSISTLERLHHQLVLS
ncbi:MAG: DUF3037 domain-containing protein [Chitinophagaceae bacterium]|nr:DUF3037 domain-containing protein [Chitinophagaceae bacterium]